MDEVLDRAGGRSGGSVTLEGLSVLRLVDDRRARMAVTDLAEIPLMRARHTLLLRRTHGLRRFG